jgi:hypothetical protein
MSSNGVSMLNLYAVLLGGRALNCNIELHDVLFVVGQSLEELYPHLVNKWFGGITKSLHIDSSVELKYVDGHEIVIGTHDDETENDKHLYFANFGGYKEGFFGEIHEMNFYAASSRIEALAKAKKDLCVEMFQQHSDDHLIVDDLIKIDNIGSYRIYLKPTTKVCDLQINSFYRKLNLPDILDRAALLKEHALEGSFLIQFPSYHLSEGDFLWLTI